MSNESNSTKVIWGVLTAVIASILVVNINSTAQSLAVILVYPLLMVPSYKMVKYCGNVQPSEICCPDCLQKIVPFIISFFITFFSLSSYLNNHLLKNIYYHFIFDECVTQLQIMLFYGIEFFIVFLLGGYLAFINIKNTQLNQLS